MQYAAESSKTSKNTNSPVDRIYLDYNATTPLDPRVFEAMKPYFLENFGNPASGQHAWGWTAEAAVTKARAQVAALVNAKPQEIYFTSGSTEGNNWAFFGLFHQMRIENPGAPIHLLTSAVEHSSVLKSAEALAAMGAEVEFLPVNKYGQVEVEQVRRALKPHTRLLSFIWTNNEIGTINPMLELAQLAKDNKIYFHSDATQAVGKSLVDLQKVGVDLLTFSGHKIYGPKGVGACYLRSQNPRVTLQPLLYGGGHERGLRSGTVNVPGAVGLGAACEIAAQELATEEKRTSQLRDLIWTRLSAHFPKAKLNGHPTERSPINVSVTLPGCSLENALPHLQKIGFSTGSACSAGRTSRSHVLAAIGLSEEEASCTLRLSVGRMTTEAEVLQAVDLITAAFAK